MAAIGVRDIDFGPWWRHEHPAIEPLGGELLQHGPARRELQRSGSVDEAAVEEHGSPQVFRTCPILERELDRPLGNRCEVHPRHRILCTLSLLAAHAAAGCPAPTPPPIPP